MVQNKTADVLLPAHITALVCTFESKNNLVLVMLAQAHDAKIIYK